MRLPSDRDSPTVARGSVRRPASAAGATIADGPRMSAVLDPASQRGATQPPQAVDASSVLDIQRTAGNRAAALVVSRQPTNAPPKPPPKPEPKAPATASVVATITLERGGTIDGTSKVPGHEGKVELDSVSQQVGRGGKPGDFIEVVLVKRPDATSSEFMRAYLGGDQVKVAKFDFLRSTEDGVEVRHSLELANGLITGISVSGDFEQISIQFRRPGAEEDGGPNS